MLPSTVNYTRSMQRMPATLLISLKLILFAMEMEEKKKKNHCYKIAKAIQLIFLRKKPLISCTVIRLGLILKKNSSFRN